jgi:hypothetical protein
MSFDAGAQGGLFVVIECLARLVGVVLDVVQGHFGLEQRGKGIDVSRAVAQQTFQPPTQAGLFFHESVPPFTEKGRVAPSTVGVF